MAGGGQYLGKFRAWLALRVSLALPDPETAGVRPVKVVMGFDSVGCKSDSGGGRRGSTNTFAEGVGRICGRQCKVVDPAVAAKYTGFQSVLRWWTTDRVARGRGATFTVKSTDMREKVTCTNQAALCGAERSGPGNLYDGYYVERELNIYSYRPDRDPPGDAVEHLGGWTILQDPCNI
ncbi:hypothetical protein B0H10DRAFT_1953580 [Mycena sp. CBHHK59/15]|nr:hypothetical protein B0H10DRAFT_1953580 [Mycena sp. CBHHK59/15]